VSRSHLAQAWGNAMTASRMRNDSRVRMASLRHGFEESGDVQDIRLVVDTIPTWSARLAGSAEFFNQRWLDYTGVLVASLERTFLNWHRCLPSMVVRMELPHVCCFGRRRGLPSSYFPCIIEYALGNREAQWRVLKAKTNEMRSSTPRPAYLRSAVLPLPQRQRYQNKLASPRELCLRTSRPRMI
jgi:hypothetical protein